ncbi:hypothetical protein DEO72_LG8g1983 [Vigna unguiculata]|uniref:Uncharacterized protein n=1 Tax=Vigna unguiculata TaxID=3917 RepID=A0A4D6MTK0_VIGUN|nr:hypothetical protein DEO72_LG8g1983 [Vigna unguiculata]
MHPQVHASILAFMQRCIVPASATVNSRHHCSEPSPYCLHQFRLRNMAAPALASQPYTLQKCRTRIAKCSGVNTQSSIDAQLLHQSRPPQQCHQKPAKHG